MRRSVKRSFVSALSVVPGFLVVDWLYDPSAWQFWSLVGGVMWASSVGYFYGLIDA